MASKSLRYLPVTLAVVALLAYGYIYWAPLTGPPIRSDGVSYYQSLPAWIADGDPTFETQAHDCCAGYGNEQPVGIHRWPETGRWLAVHPIGVAVLMLPFFLVAHALTWWSNLPRDGFSLYYQYVVGLSGLAYFVAGMAVLQRLLRRHFSDAVVLATLVSIAFGTDLFHYAVYDSTFSHTFSFFLVSSLLLLTERWWDAPTVARSLALGLVAALIVLVRHTNGLFLAIVPLYGVRRWPDVAVNVARAAARWPQVLLVTATAAAGVFPQLLIYRWTTGHWIVNSYPEGSFSFGSPHLLATLFSVERGLFFWSPLLLLSVAGLFVATAWSRGLIAATIGILAIDTYLMATWFMWDMGAGYGHRGYADALPLFAIYLASFFSWAAERPRLARLTATVAAVCIAVSIVQMWLYWTGAMPNEFTTWTQYRTAWQHVF